jgi:hypothetical protein
MNKPLENTPEYKEAFSEMVAMLHNPKLKRYGYVNYPYNSSYEKINLLVYLKQLSLTVAETPLLLSHGPTRGSLISTFPLLFNFYQHPLLFYTNIWPDPEFSCQYGDMLGVLYNIFFPNPKYYQEMPLKNDIQKGGVEYNNFRFLYRLFNHLEKFQRFSFPIVLTFDEDRNYPSHIIQKLENNPCSNSVIIPYRYNQPQTIENLVLTLCNLCDAHNK